MPVNKIGYSGQNQFSAPLVQSLSPGEVFLLPAGQGIAGTFGALASPNTGFTLSGQYIVNLGPYLGLQQFDSNLQVWRNLAPSSSPYFISSDGTNYRVANTTGTPVGAIITNAGSSLTNGTNTVTVTPSAGGSVWTTIVGGAINTTVTITNGGASFTKPPILQFVPPASQGATPYILPTAICTISSGAINAVTVINQGAGLVAAPTINVLNQPGDTTGNGAVLTVNATLAGSGTLLYMAPTAQGTGLTAVPTFTFSPASTIAATAIMNFTVTGITVAAGGAGYGNAQPFAIFTAGAQVAGTAANTNPAFDKNVIYPRNVSIQGTSTAGGAITATGLVTHDAGYGFQAVPNLFVVAGGSGLATGQGQATATVGGQNDTFVLQSL